MIGDENYKVGEPIKLFVSKVNNNTKGAQIQVTRASSDFLAALFKEEIQDVYDGTVEIKKIARYAGIRSKVAVSTNNLDMDPAGAIIGQGGNKITKVISNLGNGKIKEKIDVVAYSNIKEAFLMEALKPAKCLGVAIDEEENEADVIVPDDGYLLALGKTGINIKLVKILTGYNNIHVRTETEAREDEIEYLTKEEIDSMVAAEKANRKREAQATYLSNDTVSSLPGLPSDYVAPQDRVYEDEVEDEDISEALLEQSEKEITTPVLEETNVVEEIPVEVKEEITPVVEEKVEVKTTTNIDDLEKSLEDSKSKGKGKSFSKRKKVAKKEEEETTETITTTVDPSTYMSIYTEEELAEMEEEENIDDYYEEDDIDYDEYDSYCDDDNN
jgi:transcription antitermination factor NusA-like protein